jgi:hypothetical protein
VIEPLRIAFQVDCSVEHAFDTWTRRITTWWPVSHSVSGERGLHIELEPRVGGRIFERTARGDEYDWGQVTLWEPPTRLGYAWHLRQDRADATDVLITFQAIDAAVTRVEIEHSGWQRLGARGPDAQNANRAGWSGLLPHFVEAARVHAP